MTKQKPNITAAAIRRAADDRSYKRGKGYFENAMVYSLLLDGGEIIAKVHGTRNYRVRLRTEEGEVVGDCSCPMGDDGVFCKHMVAVGLTHLAGGLVDDTAPARSARRTRRPPKPKVTLDDVRIYLLNQEPANLVEIIVQQLHEDDRLRESLLMTVARQYAGGVDLATFRAAIDAATDTGGFIDYHEARDFTSGIDTVVDSIADLLKDGHAAKVIELVEYALSRSEQAQGEMDDSSGSMSSILDRLQELHHAACLKAEPDPETLARRLFRWEIEGDWDTFYGAAETYADVLGEKGLAVYRRLAQKLWDQIPQIGPGDDRGYEGQRRRITSIMESLARAAGDVEQLVAVMSRDLSSAHCYLRIAETYRKARRRNKAMDWAERGVKTFADQRPDSRLEDFLADQYHRRKRHDDAMALIWEQFVRRMDLSSYQHLKKHAGRAQQWPIWREKSLAAIRSSLDSGKRQASSRLRNTWRPWDRPPDHSVLVDIFLWEHDPEAAWQEAVAAGCREDLWMRLARIREKDHPADAMAVYQRQIDPIVNHKNNDAYREAAKLIRKIKQLMSRQDRETEFPEYLAAVRTAHKPKRNFMAMLQDF